MRRPASRGVVAPSFPTWTTPVSSRTGGSARPPQPAVNVTVARHAARPRDTVSRGVARRCARVTREAVCSRRRSSGWYPDQRELEYANVGRLRPDRHGLDLVCARLPAFVELGHLVEDLLLQLGELILLHLGLLLGASLPLGGPRRHPAA